MSNIKVWAENLWKIVGSGNASGISTSKVLEEGETEISVETALERLADWKDKSAGYIAWLAKNGGGGSGSGGSGSTITEATCTIKVFGEGGESITSGNSVILGNSGLTIQLADIDIKVNKTWTVIVRIGSKQVAIKQASYTQNSFVLAKDSIVEHLENHTGTLSISASYNDDVNNIYGAASWNGSILENVVELSCADASTTIDGSVTNMNNKALDFVFSAGYLGDSSQKNYRFIVEMYKNDVLQKTYQEDLKITSTSKIAKSLPIMQNLFDSASSDCIGVYIIKTTLTCITNSAITASCESNLTIASDNILIATTAMKSWNDEHTSLGYYPKVSVASSYMLDFTAYVDGGNSYYYTVKVGNNIVVEDAVGKFGVKTQQSISLTGKSWAVKDTVNKITLTVSAAKGGAGKTAISYFGVEFSEAEKELLSERMEITERIVSEMTARNYNAGDSAFLYTNQSYNSGGTTVQLTSSFTPIKGNALSVINNDGITAPYLRLSNGAMLKNHSWNYNNSNHSFRELFPEDDNSPKSLTISCCFKADYHADDYRTILLCGTINSDTQELVSGISIDVHDVYVNGTSVCKLIDNTINIVDIVVQQIEGKRKRPNSETMETITSYIIKVYVDGALTAVKESVSFPFPYSTYKVDNIYLGGRMTSTGEACYLCDCNIYNYKVYNTALSDYDIMINYINSKVTTEYYSNGTPNYDKIDAELQKNFCEKDINNNISSLLYDVTTKKYTVNSLTTIGSNGITFDTGLLNRAKAIGIPMMIIDVSNDTSWTFNNFSTQQSYGNVSLPASGSISDGVFSGRRIVYWDPNAANSSICEFEGIISLQGHSTLADFVKNINITLPETTAFIPKETWYPEQTYTLKADVVDSSHSNNAAIGAFINEVLGPDENGANSILPMDSTALDNVYKSDYKKNQQPKVTLKHTVTGFPVLLFMNFHTDASSSVSITPLGIYSFNLGRDAYRNLGFKKVNSIHFGDLADQKVETFPFLSKDATVNESNCNADWIEIRDTSEMDIINLTDKLPANFDASKGDFWQSNDNILNNRFEVRYPANTQVSSREKFKNTFIKNIMKLPIEGCATTTEAGVYSNLQITGSYNTYKCNEDGTNYTIEDSCTMTADTSIFDSNTMGMNYSSFCMYFNVAMLFGLIDNFGKNTTYRSWNGGDYYIDFYDMDSANGNSNMGELSIGTDMWLKYLYNKKINDADTYGYVAETFDYDKAQNTHSSKESKASANQNKLWLSLDTTTARSIFSSGTAGTSKYAEYWDSLMFKLTEKAKAAGYEYDSTNPSNPIVDWFMDKYYIPQTGSCGPLLFNLDYKLKYLMQFTSDTYGNMSALPKLHGRKIAYTRDWLNKHILFLDSVYNWRGSITMSYRNNVNTTSNNTILNTRQDFPIKMNTPVIFRSLIADNGGYYFAPKNKEVYTNAGKFSNNSVRTWIIGNSPNIINLGNDDIKLSSMEIQTMKTNSSNNSIGYNGLPSITVLDLSNNTTFSADFDLKAFTQGSISEIREIDFSNTGKEGNPMFNLILTENSSVGTQFTKLTKVNISNSKCIKQVTIPSVPLQELKVENSAITSFTLEKQAYLENVDLTGCSNITSVILSQCDSYKKLSLSGYTQLNTVNVTLCNSIEEIEITDCKSLTTVKIENCDSLKRITIKNCNAITGSNNSLTISGCSSLQSLNFSGCTSLKTFYISASNQSGITTLNLSSTVVTAITGDNAASGKLDLSAFTSLSNFNIGSNNAVEYIKFVNASDKVIPLNNNFSGCASLKRIYGHVAIGCNYTFNGCTNFSVHGSDVTTVKYNGKKVYIGAYDSRIRTPWELDNATNLDNYTIAFVSGDGVTNMKVSDIWLHGAFMGTSCTIFDIYYILAQCKDVTIMNATFMNLQQTPFKSNNYPDRNMFRWCKSLKNASYMFADPKDSKTINLYTPTVDNDGNIIADDGLFSPLVDSLTNCSVMFRGYNIISNRYLFRHSSKDYKITEMSHFSLSKMYNKDITGGSISSMTSSNIEDFGDFTGFYTNLPGLTNLGCHMNDVEYINYNTLSGIPARVLVHSFTSTYGSGTISPSTLFNSPSAVTRIDRSFIVNSKFNDTVTASLALQDSTFSNFTSLTVLGYNASGSYSGSGSYYDHTSFGGNGINKYINQSTFPYNIIPQSIKAKITTFAGLFKGCKAGSMTGTPVLPGTLFTGCGKLTDVSATFLNVDFAYTLEGGGFTDCVNLAKVAYLFASAEDIENKLTGQIPLKLFYHGKESGGDTYYGIKAGSTGGVTNSVTPDATNGNHWTIVKNGNTYHLNIVNGVAKWTNSSNEVVTQVLDDENITYDIMKATITDMTGCFQGANTSPFSYTVAEGESAVENNENYMPFIATYANKTFTQRVVNNKQTTGIWKWDGAYSSVHTYPSDAENLDAPSTITTGTYKDSLTDGDYGCSLNFCCAPDLLRYCSPKCIVTNLFAFAGHNVPSSDYGHDYSKNSNYGIKGRIPPYLLYPLRKSTAVNLSGMFRDCKQLSYYIEGTQKYIIPKEFFTYCKNITSLSYTFSGMNFPKDVNLNVFSAIAGTALTDIEYAFYMPYFYGGTKDSKVSISNVFSNKYAISKALRCFAATNSYNNDNIKKTQQYVKFANIFPANYYTQTKKNDSNFSEVFAYYSRDYVEYPVDSEKTLPTENSNYKYYGE